MAAHRYWRLVAIKGYGLTLRVSEVQLWSGGARADASVTLTASVAPTSGTISDLQDNTFVNAVMWTRAQTKNLILHWDFGGSPADIQEARWGAITEITDWIMSYGLQFSDDDANWTELVVVKAQAWLLPNSLSWSGPRTTWDRQWGSPDTGRTGWVYDPPKTNGKLITGINASCNNLVSTRSAAAGIVQFEMNVPAQVAAQTWFYGVTQAPLSKTAPVGQNATAWAITLPSGLKATANTNTAYSTAAIIGTLAFTLGVVINFAAGSITFYKNGVSLGVAWTGLTLGTLFISVGSITGPAASAWLGNSYTLATRLADMAFPISGALGWDEYPAAVEWDNAGLPAPEDPYNVVDLGYVPSFPPLSTDGRAIGSPAPKPTASRGDFINFNPGSQTSDFAANGAVQYGFNTTFGTLSGYVSNGGSPAQNRVVVLRMNDWRVMWVGLSDPATGFWKTTELDPSVEYVAFCIDHTGTWQAIIWDQMTLDPA